MKIDLDDLALKATVAESEVPWRVYRCDSAEDDAACGIKDEPFVSASEDCYQRGVVHDTNRDECHHHMMRCDAEFIVAAQPAVVLALVAIAKALAAFIAVHDEIDRIDPDCKLDPMSPLAAELGGRSIAAWEAVAAALKAVLP